MKATSVGPVDYRPEIDGLRAVAVLGVVGFHAFPNLVPGGYVGVDVFFVISGYLIARWMLRELQAGQLRLSVFYAHRARRLFPALALLLLVVLLCGAFVLLPDDYRLLGKHTFAGAAFIENLVLWREAGYFDPSSDAKPLLHLWSLSIEEQFYLSFPLLLVGIWRLRLPMTASIMVLTAASFLANLGSADIDAAWAFFLPQNRAWELLAGAAWASVGSGASPNRRQPGSANAADFLCLAALLAIAGCSFGLDRTITYPGAWAGLPVAATLLLIAASPTARLTPRLLGSWPLVALGLISYPLYLWHWPALSLLRHVRTQAPSNAELASVVAASVILAALTYRMVERPIRAMNPTPRILLVLSAILATVAGMGAFVQGQQGLPARVEADERQLRQLQWIAGDHETADCRTMFVHPDLTYCMFSSPGRAPDVALIGDSHANALYPGLAAALNGRGHGLLHLGGAGCVPFFDSDAHLHGQISGNCRQWMNAALTYAIETPTIQTVLLSAYAVRNQRGDTLGQPHALRKVLHWQGAPAAMPMEQQYASALRVTLDRLVASGKRVAIAVDWPELGFDPRTCLDVALLRVGALRSPCAVARQDAERRSSGDQRMLSEIARDYPSVRILDSRPALCDDRWCWGMLNDTLLYRDSHHLSKAGSQHVGAALAAQLLQGPNASATARAGS